MDIWVAVGAVVRDSDGRVLLVKHVPERDGFWAGEWICPGGGLEPGETLEEGAKREVREETDIEIELDDQIPAFSRVLEGEDYGELHVLYIDFQARPAKDSFEVTPGSDVGVAEWFYPEDIVDLDDLHIDTERLLERADII